MDAFIAAADEENLEATPVATVTKEKRLRMKWRGDLIVDLSREFLNTNGVTATASVKIVPPNPGADYRTSIPGELSVIPVEEAFVQNLGRLKWPGKGLGGTFRLDHQRRHRAYAARGEIPAHPRRRDGSENPPVLNGKPTQPQP